ncbi:MAG: ASKHA domain-containing protein [candidate division WOR-3 bacterium]
MHKRGPKEEPRVVFPFFGKSKEIEIGKTLLHYAQELNIPINAGCGGLGICKECRVRIEKGGESLSKKTKLEEELDEKERLACQAIVENKKSDLFVEVLFPGFVDKILTGGKRRKLQIDPLPKRRGNKVFLDGEEIGNYQDGLFGIAADIGTTTVVLHLINLEKGNIVYTSAFENPQKKIDGNNVISRIKFDSEYPGKLQFVLISKINEEINRMPVRKESIYDFVVVGNSTMRDLFFGLQVQSLGVSPYKSITEKEGKKTSIKVKGETLNLHINKNAIVYSPPLIGSHLGSDALSVCLSCGLFEEDKKNIMCIDIGTNTEIILKTEEGIFATSCAAGSALEPMPALPGAIYRFGMTNGVFTWETIGEVEPIGICGSGIIDILGCLIKNGLMDENGYLTKGKIFKITDKIKITQSDIKGEKGLLWSKAAISLGIRVLLEEARISLDDLDKVYLAGSFGSFIDKENAKIIGLIPDISSKKIVQVGNAAALGAEEMLLSCEKREIVEDWASKIKKIFLEEIPDYGERLILFEQKFKRLR